MTELADYLKALFATAATLFCPGCGREVAKHSARDALGLELVDQRGGLIHTTAIDISDYSREAGAEAYEVMVYLKEPEHWAEYTP